MTVIKQIFLKMNTFYIDTAYTISKFQFVSTFIIFLLIICSFLLPFLKLYIKTIKVKMHTNIVAHFSQTLIQNIDYVSKSSYFKESKSRKGVLVLFLYPQLCCMMDIVSYFID